MRIHTSRNLAKIVLAVFLFNICFVFSGVAHDPCANERAEKAAKKAVLDSAIYTRDQIEASGYMTPIAIGAGLGALGGSSGGWIGAGIGGMAGGIGGAYYHYSELESANDKVRWAADEHAKARHNLEKCEANNSSLRYHCPYCDKYWTFDTEEAYYNFSHNHQ